MITRAKKFAKKVLPPQYIHFLKKAYYTPKIMMGNRRRKELSRRRGNQTLKIGFLVYAPQSWNSLSLLYSACIEDKNTQPYLIVCPDASSGVSYIDFYREIDQFAIDVRDDEDFVRKLQVDILFQQTPYDEVFPKNYRSKYTSKYTRVCYVPYGSSLSKSKHLDISYNLEFLSYAYALFVEGQIAENFCLKKIEHQFVRPSVRVYNIGFPRFDLYRKKMCKPDTTTFLWIPRWALDSINNDATSFFKYKDELINYFTSHQNLKLIIRPHPLMFDKFLQSGTMTKAEIDDFAKKLAEAGNIILDENLNYFDTFEETSVLIADYSSLIGEFFLTGKPIIYCGNTAEFNSDAQRMMQCFYDGSTWESLLRNLEDLANENDIKYNERQTVCESILKTIPENSPQKILNQCKRMLQ